MINSSRVEKNFKDIFALIEKMPSAEKELLSDKLLAFLLFKTSHNHAPVKEKEVKKSTGKKTKPISKKDQELLKKIVDKTDELYRRLGGDTI
jgi:hypothetical protein